MKKTEIFDLVNRINLNYPYFVKEEKIDALVNEWERILCKYRKEDVNRELDGFLAREDYKNQPPTCFMLVKNLIPISEKLDLTKTKSYCWLCGRLIEEIEYANHYDRCLSIRYVILQMAKWFKKELNKNEIRELYEMSEELFEEKYNKLLNFIQNNSKDKNEIGIIECIFNPPNQQQAIETLKKCRY